MPKDRLSCCIRPLPAVLLSAFVFLFALNSTSVFAQEPVTAAGVSDWPAPQYDAGRTRHNAFELTLSPPFAVQPSQTVTYDGEADRPAAVIAHDQIFWHRLNYGTKGGEVLTATDLDGKKLWSYDAPADWTLSSGRPTVTDDVVLFAETGYDAAFDSVSNLVAVDRRTGDLLWKHPIHLGQHGSGAILTPLAVKNGRVFFGWTVQEPQVHGYFAAFDVRTGEVVWQQDVDNRSSRQTDFVAITNDTVVALHFTLLIGYNIDTGEPMWQAHAYHEGLYADVDDILATNGQVVVANVQRIVSFDASDGAQIWEEVFDENNCEDGDMALASDGKFVALAGRCKTQLAVYELSTGIERWSDTIDRSASKRNVVIANGVVYATGYSDDRNTGHISAFNLITGSPLQNIDINQVMPSTFAVASELSVANGRLYAMVPDVTDPGRGTLYGWGAGTGAADLYLSSYDSDGEPLTNPTAADVLPLTDRDGDYGAEISVGAHIGNAAATLHVYHKDGSPYKQASGTPDAYGNGFWVAPLAYDAAGYEYQVVLDDGTELPRRAIVMPAHPTDNVGSIVRTSGLQWLSTPATVSQIPTTLRLGLPGDFPDGNTSAFLMLQEPSRGLVTIPGRRSGNNVEFDLTASEAINGDFTATAVAQSGKMKVFSPDRSLKIDAPALPDVRPGLVTTIAPQPDGGVSGATFHFERTRPDVDPAQQADVQIASIVPDPAGYQVTLWVQTPASDPADARTQKWEVGLRALDANGNEIDRSTTEIEAAPDGLYMVMGVLQKGSAPIATIQALGATLANASAAGIESTSALACTPPGNGGNNGPNKKDLKVSDIFGLTVDVGAAGEAVLGAGPSGAIYAQGDAISGQSQACSEVGMRVGGEVGIGPQVALGGTINLRGPNHTAPANSGKKYDVTASAGVGVQLSYTVPDNFGDSGFGQIGISISAAPEAGLSGGASTFACWPPQNEKRPEPDRCCTGPDCGPKDPNLPGPPGGDHPDDSLSVVLQNDSPTAGDVLYWRSVARFARSQGFDELARYATFRVADAQYIGQIDGLPAGQALSETQQNLVDAYRFNRLNMAAQMAAARPVIVAQTGLMEANQANVLANGYYAEMRSMLTQYGVPNRLIGLDFSPDEIEGGLLVIPSAGLYGLDGDPTFADRLARFVSNGGTLLVMAQAEDDGLALLPQNWQQVGYRNDLSCFVDAMTPVTVHPMLASIGTASVTSHVDGYLTGWPDSAKLLMKRTKNDQGAFVLYDYGQGHMIVTNMYDDWGRTVGQTSPAVQNLFRDVVRWAAAADKDFPDTRPGNSITVDASVENIVNVDTAKVQWVVRDPNGDAVDSGLGAQSLALAPGETAQRNVSFIPGSDELGVWSLNYTLLDSNDEEVQGEILVRYFTVSDPQVAAMAAASQRPAGAAIAEPPPANVSLSLDKDAYASGETVEATLAITLPDPGAVSELKVVVSLGDGVAEKVVPTQASQQVNVSLPADFSRNGLLFYGVYDNATGQGLHLDSRWVQPQGTQVTVTPDQPRYAPGDTATLNVQGNYGGTFFVEGPDFNQTIDVANQATVSIQLPSVAASGPVQVSYDDGGMRRTAHFDLVGPRVMVRSMKTTTPQASAGATVPVTAQVQSNTALDVQLLGEMVDSNGFIFPVLAEDRSLTEGAQTISISVPFSTTSSGTGRFDLRIVDADEPTVTYAQAHRYISVDAPDLQALRTGTDSFAPGTAPSLTLDWYSPSARSLTVDFWLDGEKRFSRTLDVEAGFSSTTADLPANLPIGSHNLYAEVALGDVSTSAQTILVIGKGMNQHLYLPSLER